jgi:copper resistance protein B
MNQLAINIFTNTTMKLNLILPLALSLTGVAFAQDTTPVAAHENSTTNKVAAEADPHAGHSAMNMPGQTKPEHGMMSQPTINPDEAEYEPYKPMSFDVGPFGLLLVDQLEYRLNDGDDLFRWDAEGWYGGDINRFWFKTEGEQALQGPSAGRAEIHGYYGRLIAPFWDAQIGVRYDQLWEPGSDPSRFFGAIGLQGFAPYRFEVTPALFISEDGDVSARLTATKDYRITQRLVAQGRFETEIAAQDVPKFGVGDGFNYVELGLRLRYEIRREFAPYIGVNWERKLGETETMARQSGEDPNVLSFVAGLRIWF